MTTQARRLAAALVLAIAPLGFAIVWLAVRDDLPDRLATHFGLDGTPDGFQAADVFVAWLLPVTAVLAIAGIVVVARLRTVGGPLFAGILGYLAWLFAALGADILLAARGVADPHDVRSGVAHTLPVILVGVLAGVLLWRLCPEGTRSGGPVQPTGAYPVAPGERVVWIGAARSHVLGRIAGVVLLVGLALLGSAWLATGDGFAALLIGGAALLVLAAVFAWCRSVHVRVDNDAVIARLGGLAWPAFRVPIASIETARAQLIEPMSWGGWGYRVGPRGSAIVVRRGPGIVLSRTNGRDLAITVDDADTAASLVNGLVAVRR